MFVVAVYCGNQRPFHLHIHHFLLPEDASGHARAGYPQCDYTAFADITVMDAGQAEYRAACGLLLH